MRGLVEDEKGHVLASIFGKWDDSIYYVSGDISAKQKGYDPVAEAFLLWRRVRPVAALTKYNLTSFAVTVNELSPELKVWG